MEKFGAILKKCISQNNMSVNSAAARFGLNRGGLYNIMASNRVLPEDILRDMLSSGVFTPEQCDSLRGSYYYELYGEKTMKKIEYIISAAKILSINAESTAAISALSPRSQSENVIGHYAVFQAIKYIFEEESKNENAEIYTNFSFDVKDVDDHFFVCLNQAGSNLKFTHIVNFDYENATENNLRILFSSVRYIERGHIPMYFYSRLPIEELTLTPYPYYVASSSCLFLFDRDANCGQLLLDKAAAVSTVLNINEQLSRMKPLSQTINDELEITRIYSGAITQKAIFRIQKHPCFGMAADRELVSKFARPDLPGRDALIQFYYNYIKLHKQEALKNNYRCLFSISGTEEFAKSGVIFELSKRYAVPLEKPDRIRLLERIRDVISDGKLLGLFDDKSLRVSNRLSVEIFESGVNFYMKKTDDPFCFPAQCFIEHFDSSICKDFNDFVDYLQRSGLIIPNEQAAEIIGKIIAAIRNGDYD